MSYDSLLGWPCRRWRITDRGLSRICEQKIPFRVRKFPVISRSCRCVGIKPPGSSVVLRRSQDPVAVFPEAAQNVVETRRNSRRLVTGQLLALHNGFDARQKKSPAGVMEAETRTIYLLPDPVGA